MLTHSLKYREASFNYGDSKARDHSEQLPDSISTCDVNRGYFMLLLFLFVLLLCVCVFLFFFSRDSNMISIGTVDFRYYVAAIIPVNLGKP